MRNETYEKGSDKLPTVKIILSGPQGAGKTILADLIRDRLLYRKLPCHWRVIETNVDVNISEDGHAAT